MTGTKTENLPMEMPEPTLHTKIEAFPISIAYEQTGADVVYAYYHGWGLSYLRSRDGKNALTIVLAPTVISAVPALLFGGPIGILAFPLMITIALGIIVGLHTISPAFPLSVAQRRHPFKQPLTVMVGSTGVAVRGGDTVKVVLWNAVRKLSGDKRFIYIDMHDDLILIPRSIFFNQEHADDFFAAVRAYQRGETPVINNIRAVWPPAPETDKEHGR